MLKQKKRLGEFLGDVIRQYQALQSQPQLRLVEANENAHGKYHITVQIAGKATTFTCTPEEILADDYLVKQFSNTDVRTITYFACQTLNKPKNKIISKRFNEELNTIVFDIKNEKNITHEITATQISLDKTIIAQLSPEEAHMVGYLASQDTQSFEQEAIKKARADVHSSECGKKNELD